MRGIIYQAYDIKNTIEIDSYVFHAQALFGVKLSMIIKTIYKHISIDIKIRLHILG